MHSLIIKTKHKKIREIKKKGGKGGWNNRKVTIFRNFKIIRFPKSFSNCLDSIFRHLFRLDILLFQITLHLLKWAYQSKTYHCFPESSPTISSREKKKAQQFLRGKKKPNNFQVNNKEFNLNESKTQPCTKQQWYWSASILPSSLALIVFFIKVSLGRLLSLK